MPPPKESRPVEWVSREEIRKLFNERAYYNRVKSGEISKYVKRSSHLNPPPATEPICTHSQIAYYYDAHGDPLAIVHQYLRPDGSLGGSGLPDPKRIFLTDKIISIKSEPPN